MKPTTSAMLDALRTIYPDHEQLNRELDKIWLKDGERVMMKIEAVHILYEQHFKGVTS